KLIQIGVLPKVSSRVTNFSHSRLADTVLNPRIYLLDDRSCIDLALCFSNYPDDRLRIRTSHQERSVGQTNFHTIAQVHWIVCILMANHSQDTGNPVGWTFHFFLDHRKP